MFVGIELRLTSAEAEALSLFLGKFRAMVESRVLSCPGDTREPLLSAMGKLSERLAENEPPFDD
jgi:hypothetical protein